MDRIETNWQLAILECSLMAIRDGSTLTMSASAWMKPLQLTTLSPLFTTSAGE